MISAKDAKAISSICCIRPADTRSNKLCYN